MTGLNLKKLSRSDLLELLLDQAKEIERLRDALNQANQELSERSIKLENAGSIAEAALQISGFFDAAQEACTLYQQSITQLYQRQEAKCAQMERETTEKCSKMEQETKEKCKKMLADTRNFAEIYWTHFTNKDDDTISSGIDHDHP